MQVEDARRYLYIVCVDLDTTHFLAKANMIDKPVLTYGKKTSDLTRRCGDGDREVAPLVAPAG